MGGDWVGLGHSGAATPTQGNGCRLRAERRNSARIGGSVVPGSPVTSGGQGEQVWHRCARRLGPPTARSQIGFVLCGAPYVRLFELARGGRAFQGSRGLRPSARKRARRMASTLPTNAPGSTTGIPRHGDIRRRWSSELTMRSAPAARANLRIRLSSQSSQSATASVGTTTSPPDLAAIAFSAHSESARIGSRECRSSGRTLAGLSWCRLEHEG